MTTQLTPEEIDDLIFDSRSGELDVVKEFLANHTPEQLLQVKDEYSLATPLHMASGNGHLELVTLLLSSLTGEDLTTFIKSENDSGNTALHWASLNGHLDVVKALCDAGSDPFAKNKAGHDAFYEAEVNEQEPVIDYLLERYSIEPEEIDDSEDDDTPASDDLPDKIQNLSVEN